MFVYITRRFADSGIKLLKAKGYQVRIYPKDQIIPRDELLKNIRGASAIVPLLTEHIDEEVFRAAGSSLKIIANYAVGFDNVDLEAAKRHDVVVTNTPSERVSEAVAEHTLALMMGLARNIPQADAYVKNKQYQGWSPTIFLGTELTGKTLGLIGAGRIGASVARRAFYGLGMHVVYSDNKPNTDLEQQESAKRIPINKLLRIADFVSLHVPLLPTTRHLISTKEFDVMKKTSFLVNTARGPVVDEKALLKALRDKKIAGAALDVFECEPAIDCDIRDNLELRSFPNVILTPHIASATIEAREDMSLIAAKNIIAVLGGKKPLTPAS